LIREITPGGVVSTLAGSAGVKGAVNGIGTAATFNNPQHITVDTSGNLFVSTGDYLVREITPGALVSTVAGTTGIYGSTNGNGTCALFYMPSGIAVDTSGNVYVADAGNNMIRKISP
jgi:secreted PhoX family phosphatase